MKTIKDNTINKQLEFLARQKYRFWPKTDEIVQSFRELYQGYDSLDTDEKVEVINSARNLLGTKLLAISSFCATQALDSRDDTWIKVAVFAHLLEGFTVDYRENFLRLILIDFSLSQLSSKELWSHVEEIVDPVINKSSYKKLKEFCSRPKELNKPECAGMALVQKHGKYRYKPMPTDWG